MCVCVCIKNENSKLHFADVTYTLKLSKRLSKRILC